MKCKEFNDKLAADLEGLLDDEESRQCRNHRNQCPQCQAEYEACARLQKRLVARSEQSIEVSVVGPVMNRILQDKPKRSGIMSLLHTRWGFGLSAAAGIALIVLVIVLWMPGDRALAAEIIEQGIRAAEEIDSVHILCRVRTLPNDNFELIGPDYDFVDIEIWKQFGDRKQWRIDKPGRMVVSDGLSTYMVMKSSDEGVKIDHPDARNFDTQWLLDIADASVLLKREIQAMQLGESVPKLGKGNETKHILMMSNKVNLPQGDYLKNKIFSASDTYRLYEVDKQSNLLESSKIFMGQPGKGTLIFETVRIDYNQPMTPDVFHPASLENIKWISPEIPETPDDAYYAALSPEQAAEKFFEALGNRNWDEAGKFWRGQLNDSVRQTFGGLKVIHLGESFTSKIYPGAFVPYEIRLANGETKKHNLALKHNVRTGRWFFDGGL
ncbi:MAG: hypothetical protein LBP68_01340 [Acidobacteriota bacterium]|nr:hypothetical protein [Acidobacteriota bacterium]